jgi:hypothetical protein
MAIAGALIGGAIGAFGTKPKVPTFKEIMPDDVQKDTVRGNIANFADIAQLATSVDLFNQDQLESLIDRVLPGARQQIQENISSQLRGEIPDDVRSAITRGNSERFAGVFSGSDFVRSNEAKQLGLTSLGVINQGLASAQQWLSQAAAPRFDVTNMFFTPQQRYGYAVGERDARFQRDMIAAQVKAAPEPKTAALGTEIDRFFNTAAGVGMMAAGNAMGGGGAKPPSGGAGGLASANQSMGVANPYNMGGYNFGSTPDFTGMGLSGGQGVGIMQSSMGNFHGNWNQKYGF